VTSEEPLLTSINAAKPFGGRAPPGPAGGAHSAPPDPLAGCRGPLRSGRGRGGEGGMGRERIEEMEGRGWGRVERPDQRKIKSIDVTFKSSQPMKSPEVN
jgi:hypothetical protein